MSVSANDLLKIYVPFVDVTEAGRCFHRTAAVHFAGREVLACTFWVFGGGFGQQALEDIAIDIGLHAGPVFRVDKLDDQAAERGGALDILPRLLKIAPSLPDLRPSSSRILRVVSFEFFAVAPQQAGPAEFGGHDRFAVVRGPRLLVGHFQKEQKSDLLGISQVD